jgi:uncharacterized protein YgiM (DUF1202 family)
MKHRMLLVLTLFACLTWHATAAEPPVIPAEPAPTLKAKAPEKKAKTTPAKPTAAKGEEVITLPSPEPAVVSQKAVVVRGQARLNSEIVARLQRGDKVTVLEEIKTKKRADEPDRWYKIALPAGAAAWVDSSYLDAEKKVKPNRLNVRTGPGENYSVIGRLDKGTEVKVLDTKAGWTKIEAPTAHAYVAAHLVSREPAPATIASTPPPAPPITPTPVPPTPAVAPPIPPTPPPAVTTPVVASPVVPVVQPKPVLIQLPTEEPLARRIVTREGIVRGSVSVQAPTHFVLRSLDNKRTINYLYSTNSSISVGQYRGLRVIVTGEEALDERWPNTPVIELETLTPME